jgi:hypothetical protein
MLTRVSQGVVLVLVSDTSHGSTTTITCHAGTSVIDYVIVKVARVTRVSIPKSNVQTKQDLYSIMMLYVAPISTKHEKKLPPQEA